MYLDTLYVRKDVHVLGVLGISYGTATYRREPLYCMFL